jgi:hypothetical protein
LIAAIRNNEKYNEVERGCMASVVTSMGRMAAHTGSGDYSGADDELRTRIRTGHRQADSGIRITTEVADAEGKYPIPLPGLEKTREYA